MRYFPLFAAFAVVILTVAPASATGTIKVQQVNGSIQTYPNSTMQAGNKTLRLTSADKKGTLVITDAACSYVEKLLRCLPYSVDLLQDGKHPIPLATGTIYFNTTDSNQTLKYSSKQVPPNSVYGAFQTVHGTFVTIEGELDGGAR